jgi:hypothetical protein
MERIIGALLALVAGAVNGAARMLVPALELDVFPHRLYAAGRPLGHFDAYRSGQGSACVESQGWSVDVSWRAAGQ